MKYKKVVGYESLYEVSNTGVVKSLDRTVKHLRYGLMKKKGRILNINKVNSHGYLKATLTKNSKTKTYSVHRLVAEAFIPNPSNYPQVNHINGIKSDNRIENLEWITNRDNVNHYWKSKNKSSKYPGVSFNKNSKKWIANIRTKEGQKYLGLFNTEYEAYKEYKKQLEQIL